MNAPESLDVEPGRLWREDPMAAFERAVLDNRLPSRANWELPANHRVRDNSLQVYKAMFGKFLAQLRVNFLDVTTDDVGRFMEGDLARVSRVTSMRYLRLLERVFAHLVDDALLVRNPFTEWVVARREAGEPVKVGRDVRAPDHVPQAVVEKLHDWLHSKGQEALTEGNWRLARDFSLSSLSLGTGLRSSELRKLELKQVKHFPKSEAAQRFDFHVPASASVATGREHYVVANAACADLFEAWLAFRKRAFTKSTVGRELVFPANMDGKEMDPSTVYKSLRRLSDLAIKDGVLDKKSTGWLLMRGAQGLRRAYTLYELTAGAKEEMLQTQLGMWDRRSIERYSEELRNYQKRNEEVNE